LPSLSTHTTLNIKVVFVSLPSSNQIPMSYPKFIATLLFVFAITFLHAQSTAGLPKAVLVNKAGNSVSTASISDFDNPVIVLTYSENWCSSCVKLITELDNNYSTLGTQSNVKIVAVNVDKNLTATEVFSKASRWKNVEVLFDKSQEFMKAMYTSSAPVIFFMDDNQQVIYTHTTFTLDIKKAYKLAGQIKRKEVQAKKVFFDKDWFPTPEADAVYYRIISKKPDDSWRIVDYFKNGAVQMLGEALLPFPLVRRGKYQYYYQDGKLSGESNYTENVLIGRSTGYYNNGQLEYDYTYAYGKLEGKWTKYHSNGKVANTGNYSNGSATGVFYHYYESGKKRKETNWAYGKMNGKCTGWYENGKLKFEAEFENGTLQDYPVPKYYHENGRQAVELKKDNNKSTLSYIDDKGVVFLLLEATGSLFELSLFYSTGQMQLKTTLKDNITVNGKYITWYENGQKKFEATFFNNEPSGKAISWYDNGTVKEKVDFTNNTKEFFDKQGNKVTSVPDPSIKIEKGQKLSTQYITSQITQIETLIKDEGK
jgi:antitoxin component YwqK of YwqJK toxin-antitoxin module